MHERDRALYHGAGLSKSGFVAGADIHNVSSDAALRRCGRPSNRCRAHEESNGRAYCHLCFTFAPTDWNREFLSVNFVHTGVMESFNGPSDGLIGCRRTRDAAANFIGQMAQILLKRRRAFGAHDHSRCKIGARFLDRAGACAYW